MEDTSKANIVFNISGGNNQILPNAIKAEQNFYGDKYIEEMMKAKTTSQEPVLSPETTRLSLYINNVEALAEYVAKLSACTNAKELAQGNQEPQPENRSGTLYRLRRHPTCRNRHQGRCRRLHREAFWKREDDPYAGRG